MYQHYHFGSDNFSFARTYLWVYKWLSNITVCVSNEHLVVLNQMSKPNLFGLNKMPKWSDNTWKLTLISNTDTIICYKQCQVVQYTLHNHTIGWDNTHDTTVDYLNERAAVAYFKCRHFLLCFVKDVLLDGSWVQSCCITSLNAKNLSW